MTSKIDANMTRFQRTSSFDIAIAKFIAAGVPSARIAKMRLGVIINLDRYRARNHR